MNQKRAFVEGNMPKWLFSEGVKDFRGKSKKKVESPVFITDERGGVDERHFSNSLFLP